jgi:hypothetical protein
MAKGRFKSLSVSETVYNKLKEIAARRGFSTLSDTVAYLVALEELVLRRLESITATAGNVTATSGNLSATNATGEASVAKATIVADPSYRLVDRSEGDGIIVEVYDGEPNTIDGGLSDSGAVAGTETSTVNRSSGTATGTGQYRKKQYKKRYKGMSLG